MKFALSWLKYFLETDADAAAIAKALNRIGLEVEGVENPADKLKGFHIARVITAAPHPQADKLQLLSVDAGPNINGGNPLQIVCGAPNARAGLTGVLGLAGAVVPANGMELRVAAVRGVESHGMMCSSRELELGDDHDGIIELDDGASIGTPFAEHAGLDDPIFDISITPNRQDCMGVMGIARDLAAAGLGIFKPFSAAPLEGSFPCPVEIRTDDTEGCPAFYGRVIRGVKNGPSPEWMQARLKSAGQKPISALVDITNYLSLAFGRPAHVYDLAKLSGAVVARKAREGEEWLALNGKTYALIPSMTVIADETQVHDIAGIMGGEHSGCQIDTTDVLLEIAYFTPENIAKTGQALALTSDARSRFERGVDPAFLDAGVDIATDLILRLCGGEASHVVRAGEPPLDARTVAYDASLSQSIGGIAIAPEAQKAILEALGFTVADDWKVTIPTWRRDIDGAADLVEEVVRITGLDHVQSVSLPRAEGVARPTASPMQRLERTLRRAAASEGLNEAITWSFLPEKEAELMGGGHWSLANPISEDLKVMRPSLLPGLLSATARGQARGTPSIRLFELGRRYLAGGEHPTLTLIMAGEKQARSWQSGKATSFDAFDAKAMAYALLGEAGVPTDNLQIMGEAGAQYHPGQSATLRLGPKTVLASFGMVHPSLLKAFDVGGGAASVTLFLDAFPAKKQAKEGNPFLRTPYAPPALQAVTRDFAFLVPMALPAGDLVRTVKGADKANIVAVRLFDDFRGQGVPEGHKSLALEVTLQPQDKSYTDADLKAISERVVGAAAKHGAELRG